MVGLAMAPCARTSLLLTFLEVSMSQQVLKALGLGAVNSGTYLGQGEWSTTSDAGILESVNPSDGEAIAKVHASSQADYEIIIQRAQSAFNTWRTMPAPKRGEAIRLCGE